MTKKEILKIIMADYYNQAMNCRIDSDELITVIINLLKDKNENNNNRF